MGDAVPFDDSEPECLECQYSDPEQHMCAQPTGPTVITANTAHAVAEPHMQFGLNSPSLNSENVASAEPIALPAYSSYECLQRLQTLQRICTALALDALLFVGGVDGRHHEASREVLAWLLGGESGRVVFGRGGTDVELDEVVLVVTPTAARLYCPAAVYSTLAARLGLWPRLQLFRPAAALEDAEALEEHKIRAFIAMVEGLGAIGVPLPEQGGVLGQGGGDAKAVEMWPLIQAFALQDFEAVTGGGFFSQRHRCVPCAAAVAAPLCLVDARALRWLAHVEARAPPSSSLATPIRAPDVSSTAPR